MTVLLNGFPVLDDRLAFGFQSDPQFLTTGPRFPNGGRQTNPLRTLPLMVFTFTYNNQTLTDIQQIREMYYDVDGANGSFLMKDFIKPEMINRQIGVGDTVETDFQITLPIGSSKSKVIKHIQPGTLRVFLDGVETFDFTEALGLTTLGSAPGSGVIISIHCGYYYRVKFDQDRFPAARIAAPNPTGKIQNLTATEQPE